MKIKKLIKELKKIKRERGNIHTCIIESYGRQDFSISVSGEGEYAIVEFKK